MYSVIVLCGMIMMKKKKRGEDDTRCRLIACSSRKAPRWPPDLTSPSDERIAINSTIYLLNIHTGFVMYNLAIRKCTSPPLLAPRLKIFKWNFTTPPGIELWTLWTRGRHATMWASAASVHTVGNCSLVGIRDTVTINQFSICQHWDQSARIKLLDKNGILWPRLRESRKMHL